MCGKGGHVRQRGACMVKKGMHGEECAWQEGGGMHGRGACMAGWFVCQGGVHGRRRRGW